MKRYGYLVPALILSGLFQTLPAQAPDTLGTRTYGGLDDDVLFSIDQTSDGVYIIGGTTRLGTGFDDYWLVRTNALGDTLWTRTFGGGDRDEGRSIQQTADCGFVVAGYTEPFGAGSSDVWLMKTDSLGNTAPLGAVRPI